MKEAKYQLCSCGSGKKLKFCCYEKRASLDGASDDELIRRAAEFRVDRCFISVDWQEKGIAEVIVVRQMPNLKYLVGGYLVDVFCLGVKNTFVLTRLKHEAVRDFMIPGKTEDITYEDARSVVIGGVDYARRLGFEPHEDWEISGGIIESERSFNRKFAFGQDGLPLYIQGPHDDVESIMARLEPLVKEGRAHYLRFLNPDGLADDGGMSFDERCDEVSSLFEDKRFEDAREEIESLMEEFPERSEPLFLMGGCLGMEGKAAEAIPFFLQSIALEPSSGAYYNLGIAYKILFKIEEWVDCLNKAIELDGTRNEYGKRAKADLDSFSSVVQTTSGLTLDRYFENKRQFDRAFQHLREGRYEDAIRGFIEVLKVEPRHVQSYGNLGLAFSGLGDRERAIEHLDKAIELDPGYEPAIENRRILLSRPAGERLDAATILRIEFYADRARAG